MEDIKGIIFDYGGTIDTNGIHWSEVLWKYYRKNRVPVDYYEFRDAYVFAERALVRYPYIKPRHNFLSLLVIKVNLELEYLHVEHIVDMDVNMIQMLAGRIAKDCYDFVLEVLSATRPVIERLSEKYPLALVSNFYGNMDTVLADFGLGCMFGKVIESSKAGVRKPDPAIYRMGVEALGLNAQNVLVVGDSFSKDVVPAKEIGCEVTWLVGKGWRDEEHDKALADYIISDIKQLIEIL